MCTLTVIPKGENRWRLAFNRDEQRSRPGGQSPQRQAFGHRLAMLPIDSLSGGTWIAVNDAGLVLALLNGNPKERRERATCRSRGTIIPSLLEVETIATVFDRLDALHHPDYPPFRLVAIKSGFLADWRFDGDAISRTDPRAMDQPQMYTSSGLGDHLVDPPRRDLFHQMFPSHADWTECQDRYHQHSWPESPHLSVCMRRPDACTVSYTTIEWDQSQAWMSHHPAAPDLAARPSIMMLPLNAEAA